MVSVSTANSFRDAYKRLSNALVVIEIVGKHQEIYTSTLLLITEVDMVGRHCVLVGCSNGDYRLSRWKKTMCQTHNCFSGRGQCICDPPFQLFSFPAEKSDSEGRKKWIEMVNRKSLVGKCWTPTTNSRMCSNHFMEGKPTVNHPYPSLRLGYHFSPRKTRAPPLPRQPIPAKKSKRELLLEAVPASGTPSAASGEEESVMHPSLHMEHDYYATTAAECVSVVESVSVGSDCNQCREKDREIHLLKDQISSLESRISEQVKCSTRAQRSTNVVKQFASNDKHVRENTGLSSVQSFNSLYAYIKPKASIMRYWHGQKKSGSGLRIMKTRARSLTVKEELILVLMKIRLGLTNSFIACLYQISVGTCSSIINTWIKFLSAELKPLVFWPEREVINAAIPQSLKVRYPKLRCTLDCSETFIQRPKDLYLQSTTWSEYKHHNTLKYLVCIAPNGHISYVSEAWGGRATDRFIVQQSGLLDLIDPGDTILADRGFNIQEDLLFHHATVVIPPPGSGKQQMSAENVKKTKSVANARIHVERAINRIKWFKLLSTILPVTLVPLFDDILCICSALCNLLPPLVQS